MSRSPAFQFYPSDWLSSPKVAVMTPAQEGAYIRLLCYCWGSGDCSIPDDDDQLAIMSRLGEGWLNGGSTVVRRCFMPHPTRAGHLTNERLLSEAIKQEDWRRKSAEGGRRSRENARLSKGGSAVVQPPVNSLSSSSSSEAKASSEKHSAFCAPDWIEREVWTEFLKNRNALRAKNSPYALNLVIKDLEAFRHKGHDPTVLLKEAIKRGWRVPFEPKPSSGEKYGQQSLQPSKDDRARSAVLRGLGRSDPAE